MACSSGLPTDDRGRVLTTATLEVIGHKGLFATGDCAVINHDRRPPSGVWAVRAAKPLARNLEASSRNQPLRRWQPQARAVQLLGSFQADQRPTAWALWGPWLIGLNPGFGNGNSTSILVHGRFRIGAMRRPENNAG